MRGGVLRRKPSGPHRRWSLRSTACLLLLGCSRGLSDTAFEVESLLQNASTPTIVVRRPLSTTNRVLPAIVILHGGAWVRGSRDDVSPLTAAWLSRGWAVVLPHYRLGPAASPLETAGDVMCALQWIRQRAKFYHLDTGRVVVAGVSAGAHLAMLAATGASRATGDCRASDVEPVQVSAVVDWFGPADLDSLDNEVVGRSLLRRWMGLDTSVSLPVRRQLSALASMRSRPPPLLIVVHADGDSIISFRHAEWIAESARLGGAHVERITLHDQSHGLDRMRWAAVDDSVFSLLQRGGVR
jgi:acetyl esterase/lipase